MSSPSRLAAVVTAGAAALAKAASGAGLVAVPFTDVQLDDAFWRPRLEVNRTVTVPYTLEQCERTGRVGNFAVAGGLEEGEFEGIFFNDSDVFKVLEGAAYTLAAVPDPALDARLDDLIEKIAAAQEDDGYLYTIRTIQGDAVTQPGAGPSRWSNLAHSHELYNVGHLYEAAVAHHQATGKKTLLDVACRNADLVAAEFGPGGRHDPPGHEEIELALVRLYRATGRRAYLDLAAFFLDARGVARQRELYGAYAQDHRPVREQREAVGHAVRAGYLYCAMADVAAETGDAALGGAVDELWRDVVEHHLYVTGGIGASSAGEAFGARYELPNAAAYNETCAAIALALWTHRMYLLRGHAEYVDVLERVLYNGLLAGVSLEGDTFFYPNPLACDGRRAFNQGVRGRSPWFSCSCCPVNVVRFLPQVPGFVYARDGEDIVVNLYAQGAARIRHGDGRTVLRQVTRYPHDGAVTIRVEPAVPRFALRLRLPGWVRGRPVPGSLYRYVDGAPAPWSVLVNGAPVVAPVVDGYVVIDRAWTAGDVVELALEMPVRRVVAHERVEADRGRVAFERGPLVYCFEGVDNGGDVADLLAGDAPARAEWRAELGGFVALAVEALRLSRDGDATTSAAVTARAVPYYAWAHRAFGPMAVWMAATPSAVTLPPAATIASRATPRASHTWASDTVEALNDQVEPRGSGDHGPPRHTWWDRRGTVEWAALEFAEPENVSAVEVYWFDDRDRGRCRVPRSWRLLYRVDGAWREVDALDAYGVERDRYNRVRFAPVTTDALRLEAQLRAEFSGGILEWRVYP